MIELILINQDSNNEIVAYHDSLLYRLAVEHFGLTDLVMFHTKVMDKRTNRLTSPGNTPREE